MIPTDLQSSRDAKALKIRLEAWRGGEDLSVGVGSLLWPSDGIASPAMMFHLTEGGYFLATDGDLTGYYGWIAQWLFDGDRFGLVKTYDDPIVLWVEHAVFPQEVKEMRTALTAEDVATVATESRNMISNANADSPDDRWVRQNNRLRKYQVSLQMHRVGFNPFEPDCWLVSGGGQPDNLSMFWVDGTEDLQSFFKERYNWQSAGWLDWAVEREENPKPFTRTKLYSVTARTPAEAALIVRSMVLRDQGLPVG